MMGLLIAAAMAVSIFGPAWLALESGRPDLVMLWLFAAVPAGLLILSHIKRPPGKMVSWRAVLCCGGLVLFGCGAVWGTFGGAVVAVGGIGAALLAFPKNGGWYAAQ